MKKQLLAVATVATIGIGAGVPLVASADTSSTQSGGTSIVDKIATKFNLNKSDVQKVFDEDRAAHQAEHEQKFKDRLAQLVKDGKISQAQADKIQAKHDEIKTYMESLKDKTPSERHAAMKTKMDELKQWAKDNGIDEQYLMPGHPGGRGGHMKDQSAVEMAN